MKKYCVVFVVMVTVFCMALSLTFSQEPYGGILASIDTPPKMKEIPVNIEAVKSIIKQNLEERGAFSTISKMVVDASCSYNGTKTLLIEPPKDDDDVKIENTQVSYNGVPINLIRANGNSNQASEKFWVFLNGNIYTSNYENFKFVMLVNPRAIKVVSDNVIYLASMSSEVFFFYPQAGNTSWGVSTDRAKQGKTFPIYLTADTISNEQYEAKYGQFVGVIKLTKVTR